MCGITGFFEVNQRHDRAEMQALGKAMSDAIKHRGPDDAGHWQDPDIPLLFGHRRLAIIDLSEHGHQPMVSASERFILCYNGEIYNYQELMRELEELGAQFKGRSDTEVMLAAFETWGINQALQRLNGMFAFVLWDRKKRELHFMRDRFGKKPLYIGWAEDTLVFGSELKALKAYPAFKAEINRNVLALYMGHGNVPAPYCIYNNVWQLPSGSRMTLDLGTLKPRVDLSLYFEPYWHHARVVEEAKGRQKNITDQQAINEFEDLLFESVRSRMVSDVPVGAFLSGGIDSSSVVSVMQAIAHQPVKTFSIGFEEQGYDEATYAKQIASHLGTNHHELYLKPEDALNVIPSLPEIYDEPFADVSQIPTYLVSKFAREQVTVALSGDGGDEMLAGYLRHYVVPALWSRVGWLPGFMRKGMSRAITSLSSEKWDSLVPQQPQFGQRLYKVAGLIQKQNPEHAYRYLISQNLDPESLVPGSELPGLKLFEQEWQPKGLSFAERMMFGDALHYLPNDILVKTDRASMAVSLELRSPLLDKNIFEYVWTLPHKMKVRKVENGLQGKWLLRELLKKYVPETMFERQKQGFSVPVGVWLKDPLKDWAEDLIDENKLSEQGHLDSASVRMLWQEHLEGKGRHEHKLWTILMFQSWLEAQ